MAQPSSTDRATPPAPRRPAYIPLGAAAGLAIGAGLGVVFHMIPVLMPAGVAIGAGVGVLLTRRGRD
ncbi:MAG: hypothetical protein IT355_13735 [Gemmatimonadaceae bacterium]|nr:hypothetical protein [Gemmatimonadaceae bacterium]